MKDWYIPHFVVISKNEMQKVLWFCLYSSKQTIRVLQKLQNNLSEVII